MNRRHFLAGSAAAAAVAFPAVIPARALARPGRLGANDRPRVGIIGVGGRARSILKDDWPAGEVDLVAVADCFAPRCAEAAALIPGGERWRQYPSFRAMLDREKLDAVFVETTTHNRVRICLHALAAGLDVYAEKPIALTIAEGRALSDAVARTGRVLQCGTQQRSMPINQFASALVREGKIGKVTEVITFNFLPPEDWLPRAGRPVPAGLDWDEWCGQTELRPYHPGLHYGWGKYVEYDGGGQSWGVTGWGTHSLDQVQCALGTDGTGPVEIWPEEPGPFGRVTMRYANGTLLKLAGPKRSYEDLGAIFVGTNGRIEILRGSAIIDPAELRQGAPPDSPSVRPGETIGHVRNFLECVKSRAVPNAPAEAAHRATTVCHLVNIARTLGRHLYWDPAAETFTGEDAAEANEFRSRTPRAGFELPRLA
jgi:predicted dehydrogenase